MHEEMFLAAEEAITNGLPDNIVDAAPRGNAKSTIFSFALPLWAALFELKHYIIIVSDTADQANDFLGNIKSELEDNTLILEDFGSQYGYVWTNSDIILRNDVRIQALGAGKKIRGRRYKQYRPDLIIGDDLENDENVQSPDQRKKDETWFTRALSKAGDERTDKIIIGTIIHYDSLLAKLLKNPLYQSKKYQSVIRWSKSNLWTDWERMITNLDNPNRIIEAKEFYLAHEAEMLEGTEVLWPSKEPYYTLMIQRVTDGPAAFSSEKQNEPLSDDERRFLPEWIHYYDDSELIGRNLITGISVDPSMGKVGGDYSAIITGGIDNNGIIYVLEADIQKRHPDVIVNDFISHAIAYGCKTGGVEQNQFQEYFKDTLQKRLEEAKVDISVKGLKTHSDKILRIQSLQPDIKNGRLRFRRTQQRLIDQLINFPSDAHDDGPDALEMLVQLLGKRSGFASYFESLANESNNPTTTAILQNPGLQGFTR